MRFSALTACLIALALPVAAETPSGRYSGLIDGKPATLILSGPAGALTGSYAEEGLSLTLSGTSGPQGVSLTLTEPTYNLTVATLTGTSEAGRIAGTLTLTEMFGGGQTAIAFTREGAAATAATASRPSTPSSAAGPASARLDSRLVGTWVNEDIINSGGGAGGFASFSTVMTMTLSPDGRVVQTSRSVGGGGEWSSDSGERTDFDGQWEARDGTLYVKGMGIADFTAAATYSFSGAYLVTNGAQGRLIWQRR